MQYENNLRKKMFYREKKTTTRKQDLVFKKTFFQKVHLEKGGSSYIRVNTVV